MDELTNLKIKATALTVKQNLEENFKDFMFHVNIFKTLKKKEQLKWISKCEEEYKKELPEEKNLPNLYEIGKAYLRWQIYLDLYNNDS